MVSGLLRLLWPTGWPNASILGILLHTWEQKLLHSHNDRTIIGDLIDRNVQNHLAEVNSKAVENALHLWRIHWSRTVSRPECMPSTGLYRDRALAYYFLGSVMNRNRNIAGANATLVPADDTWTLKVPRLLRRLTNLLDSGMLEISQDTSSSTDEESIDYQLRNIQESIDDSAEAEGMDTIILGCMMRKDRNMGNRVAVK